MVGLYPCFRVTQFNVLIAIIRRYQKHLMAADKPEFTNSNVVDFIQTLMQRVYLCFLHWHVQFFWLPKHIKNVGEYGAPIDYS